MNIWHTCRRRCIATLTVFTVIVSVIAATLLSFADCLSMASLVVTTAFFYINLPHTSIFIALKFGKLLLSVLFVVIHALISRNDITAFALTFIGFYIVYLLFETLCLVRLEKSLSKDTK